MVVKYSELKSKKLVSVPETVDFTKLTQTAYGFKSVITESDTTKVTQMWIGVSNSLGQWVHPTQDLQIVVLKGLIKIDAQTQFQNGGIFKDGQAVCITKDTPYTILTDAENTEILLITSKDFDTEHTQLEDEIVTHTVELRNGTEGSGMPPQKQWTPRNASERAERSQRAEQARGVVNHPKPATQNSPYKTSAMAEYYAAQSGGPPVTLDMRNPQAATIRPATAYEVPSNDVAWTNTTVEAQTAAMNRMASISRPS